ncbi:MAG: tRNA 4-thiouridine(8) synthase ThiI [Bradymonadaceae bacterium]|nr:tRNA 4-thiouridine(8) synthase ThiI [Lujinxingiaceae bacterium]
MSLAQELSNNRLVIVLRLSGEMCTKAPSTRKRFQSQFLRNIAAALGAANISHTIRDQWYRVDVETDDERAVEILSRVFGVQKLYYSRAQNWSTIEDIVAIGASLFDARVANKRFAVEARRVGNRELFDFNSQDLERALGKRLVEAGGRVDLSSAEVHVGVELRPKEVFFFDRELSGPAGLPSGVEGRALSLMSGGFDSAVASWMMLKRGVALDFLFFDLGGPPHQRAVREVTDVLAKAWVHGYAAKLHIVDFRPVIAEMKQGVRGRFWQLLLKRLMVRAGDLVARDGTHIALITGEALGQVSSQTLSNLAAISVPLATPVLRPLLGFNKDEIIAQARLIGTYEICSGVPEFCALGGGKPVTRSTMEQLDAEEARLDSSLLETLVAHRRVLSMDELGEPLLIDVEVDRVPGDALVVDLRSPAAFKSWSYPDAVNVAFETAIHQFTLLPRDRCYLLFCDVGLKSAFLAEALRPLGYKAFSLRGGLRTLKRLAPPAA